MNPTVIAVVIGFTVLGALCAVNAVTTWRVRQQLLAVFGPNPKEAQLRKLGYYLRPGDWAPEPGPSSKPRAPAVEPAKDPASGSSGPGKRAADLQSAVRSYVDRMPRKPAADPASAQHGAREPFELPKLGPAIDYTAQAARIAPDADDDSPPGNADAHEDKPPSFRSMQVNRQPIPREGPELPVEPAPAPAVNLAPELPELPAPETTPKAGAAPHSRMRDAVTARPGLAAWVAELDATDGAQAEQAPKLLDYPSTLPPPSSLQEQPAASGAHVAGAPPVSGAVASPDPSLKAAGLGRVFPVREKRSEAPPPIKSEQPSLLGGLGGARSPRPAAPKPTGEPLPVVTHSEGFDDEDEPTQIATRPSLEQLGLTPGAQAPKPRAQHATLPSMPSVVPASIRPETTVETVNARPPTDEERAERAQGDNPSPA